MGSLINDYDINLFHNVAQEVQRLAGVEVAYWHFDVNSMKQVPSGKPGYDPLYGEKVCNATWGYTGKDGISSESELGKPFLIWGIYEEYEPTWSASERGAVQDTNTEMWFSKKDFDLLGIGLPNIGDILKYRFDFWNVTNVVRDGWIDMSHTNYSLYKLTTAFNTRILPETRIDDERI